jgi:hypothetical protein
VVPSLIPSLIPSHLPSPISHLISYTGTCYEIDLLEANNNAMQSAIHTETGGAFGSGNVTTPVSEPHSSLSISTLSTLCDHHTPSCARTAFDSDLTSSFASRASLRRQCDRNGCYARVGGPQAPTNLRNLYGKNGRIDSSRPFEVEAAVDGAGALSIVLSQGGTSVVSFDRHSARPTRPRRDHSALLAASQDWAAAHADRPLAHMPPRAWDGMVYLGGSRSMMQLLCGDDVST